MTRKCVNSTYMAAMVHIAHFTCWFYPSDVDADRLHVAVCCLPIVLHVQSHFRPGVELWQGSARGMLGGKEGEEGDQHYYWNDQCTP